MRGQGRGLRRGQDVELVALAVLGGQPLLLLLPLLGRLSKGVRGSEVSLTFVPTISDSPSGCHARVKASPRPFTSLTQALVRTSQNLTTPSLLTEQSSASLTGLKATFSIGAAWPFSSVEKRTLGFSGFPLGSRQLQERYGINGEAVALTDS